MMKESITYDDYLAGAAAYRHCLDPGSCVISQMLAETLLAEQASGIFFPGVRHQGGACLVCFRPALVGDVRKIARYRFTWTGSSRPLHQCGSGALEVAGLKRRPSPDPVTGEPMAWARSVADQTLLRF
ncbi:MAG: RES family NAD+ phosphorylase [Rhodobacteraceae bacterium]|nr:RES family NAD+ phosphorylase [Paracoccaceae bacterium]